MGMVAWRIECASFFTIAVVVLNSTLLHQLGYRERICHFVNRSTELALLFGQFRYCF